MIETHAEINKIKKFTRYNPKVSVDKEFQNLFHGLMIITKLINMYLIAFLYFIIVVLYLYYQK